MTDDPSQLDTPRAWLKQAILEIAEEQPELWSLQIGERARVGHIFARLREIVPRRWDVDMEWDRQGVVGDRKWVKSAEITDRYGIPDMVIHRRSRFGTENNLLVIEVKLDAGSLSTSSDDFEKVTSWMTQIGYRFGALVSLGTREIDTRLMWLEHPIDRPSVENF